MPSTAAIAQAYRRNEAEKRRKNDASTNDETGDDEATCATSTIDPMITLKVYCDVRSRKPRNETDSVTVAVYERREKYSFYKNPHFWISVTDEARHKIYRTKPYAWAKKTKSLELKDTQKFYQTFGSNSSHRWEQYQSYKTGESIALPEKSPSGFYKAKISFYAKFGPELSDSDSDYQDDILEELEQLSPEEKQEAISKANKIYNNKNVIALNNLNNRAGLAFKIFQVAELHTSAMAHFYCVNYNDAKLKKQSDLKESIYNSIVMLLEGKRIDEIPIPKNPEVKNNIEGQLIGPILRKIRKQRLTHSLWRGAHHYAIGLKTLPAVNLLDEEGRRIQLEMKDRCDDNIRRIIMDKDPLLPPHLQNVETDPIQESERRHEHASNANHLAELSNMDLDQNATNQLLRLTADTTPVNDSDIDIDDDEKIDLHPKSTSGISSAVTPPSSHRTPSPDERDWKRTTKRSRSPRNKDESRKESTPKPLPRQEQQQQVERERPECKRQNDERQNHRRSTDRSSDRDSQRRYERRDERRDYKRNDREADKYDYRRDDRQTDRRDNYYRYNERHTERRDDNRRNDTYRRNETPRQNQERYRNPAYRGKPHTKPIAGNIDDDTFNSLQEFDPQRFNATFKATKGKDGRVYMLPNRTR